MSLYIIILFLLVRAEKCLSRKSFKLRQHFIGHKILCLVFLFTDFVGNIFGSCKYFVSHFSELDSSSKKRPRFEKHKRSWNEKNLIAGPDGSGKQEWLCWRRPVASHCSTLRVRFKMRIETHVVRYHFPILIKTGRYLQILVYLNTRCNYNSFSNSKVNGRIGWRYDRPNFATPVAEL